MPRRGRRPRHAVSSASGASSRAIWYGRRSMQSLADPPSALERSVERASRSIRSPSVGLRAGVQPADPVVRQPRLVGDRDPTRLACGYHPFVHGDDPIPSRDRVVRGTAIFRRHGARAGRRGKTCTVKWAEPAQNLHTTCTLRAFQDAVWRTWTVLGPDHDACQRPTKQTTKWPLTRAFCHSMRRPEIARLITSC